MTVSEGVARPAAIDPLASVHHDGSDRYVRPLGGVDPDRLRVGDRLRIRVRAGFDAPVERVVLRTTPDGEQVFEEMSEVEPGPACRWWEIELLVSMPSTGYRFLVLTDGGHRWLNGSGLHVETPTDRDDFLLLAGYDPPHWLADRVFYQIFPDRFANGDPTNDIAAGAWSYRGHEAHGRPWDALPARDRSAMVEFFGGDLAGIEAHLDHLVELGVNAIYLTPIFSTRSNHGYDIIDYDHVADHFGGDTALVSLRHATRAREIRLMLDVAPNHIGVEHPWFRAAQADPDAPTASYFVFRDHPDDYESWLGVGSLPKLDYRSQALRDAMYAGPDAVLRHWLRPPYDIDGWRIDVANMLGRLGPVQLGPEVARGMRAAVKAEDPEAYLLGEHSYDAIDHLSGDAWDAVMNYWGFQRPVLEWLRGMDLWSHASGYNLHLGPSTTASMVRTLDAFRAAIAWTVARSQYNLLGSHDTARVVTELGGDPGRIRAAYGLLMTYVGVPSILYGDEIGLEGVDGTDARRPMPWDPARWDGDLLVFMRHLIRFRVGSDALCRGGFQVLEIGGDHLAFMRDTDAEWVVVIIGRGPGPRPAGPLPVRHGAIPDGIRFTESFTGATSTVRDGVLDLPATPPGAALWIASIEPTA